MVRLQASRSEHREHSVPLYATSSFVYENAEQAARLFTGEEEGYIYSRYSNPNNEEFLQKLCVAEHLPKGITTASGMAAMFASIAAFLKQGDHILASRSLFGSTHQLLTQVFPKWGISHTLVDIHDFDNWHKAIRPETRMVFVESPSNPGLDLIDLSQLVRFAKQHGLLLNVDNCFATPYNQQPGLLGADIVTHSATKFIDGQGRVLAGAVLCTEDLYPDLQYFGRHTGPSLSPFHSWLLSKSMETLALRMEHHANQALKLAHHLQDRSGNDINRVKYPFLSSHPQHELAKRQMVTGGGIVTFELNGGIERSMRMMNQLKMITLSSNLGDTRTICTHPASTTHSKLTDEERQAVGITSGLIRISVGFEHIEDIIDDLDHAIKKSK